MHSVPLPSARSGLRSSSGSLSERVRCVALKTANMGCFLDCAARLLRAQRDARFHITRGFASPPRVFWRDARWQKSPGHRRERWLHPSRSLDATSPRDPGWVGGTSFHWTRRADHVGDGRVKKKEREEEGKTRLVGDCQSKENIFTRLERWHEKRASSVRRSEAPSPPLCGTLVEQLHICQTQVRDVPAVGRKRDVIGVSREGINHLHAKSKGAQ